MSCLVNELILEAKFNSQMSWMFYVLQHGCHESIPLIKLAYGRHRNVKLFHVSFDVSVTDHTLARSDIK